MAFQVDAKTKTGGTVRSFVESAQEALEKINSLLNDGQFDITVRDDKGEIIDLEALKVMAGR